MRFKVDENLGRSAVEQLRAAGHDAHSVADEGLCGATDEVVSQAAAAEQRVVVTLDLHFADVRRFPPAQTPGIVVLRLRQRGPEAVRSALRRLLGQMDQMPLAGCLWIVTDRAVRTSSQKGPIVSNLFQTHFSPAELTARRAQVLAAIGPDAVALLQGAAPPLGFVAFRQTNEVYYLCGLEVPQVYLLLDGRSGRSTIYLPPRRETPGAEGDTLGAQDEALIREHTGVDAVRPIDDLADDLAGAARVYTPHMPAEGFQSSRDEMLHAERLIAADPWDAAPTREQRLIGLLRERLPEAEILDLSPLTDRLRGIKSSAEIAVMRRAGQLSAEAILAAMEATRPGLYEYQLNALANQVYLHGGARGEGYRSITAAGAGNIWFAHYWRCDCPLRSGDLVLMDTAPDYGYYTSDIGRMWPVDGVYSAQARELYGFVVEYHRAVLAAIRPGLTADQVHADAAAVMAPVVERWPWSKPEYEAAGRRMLDFRGHLSHPVGMIVHDVDNYTVRPLEPGVVFAVDPQMWVPEEKLYLRCEDTVVVTADGIENFTAAAPLGLDETEALLAR